MGKKSAPPPAPDYTALAQQQAELDKVAAADQTVANRPTQTTPWGTSSWSQGADGQWTQNISLDPAEQAALDQQRQFSSQRQGIASGLLDNAGQTLGQPMSLEGLPQLRDYDTGSLTAQGQLSTNGLPGLSDMDLSGMNKLDPGFGAVEAVRDAMMSRLNPARQQGRESEIQRLKNQGIPENSEAFQRALTRLDQGDTDAQQQALLGAATEYGNIFNRGLSANNQQLLAEQAIAALRGDQRGQLFNEQGAMANLANQNRSRQFDEQGQQAQLAGMLRQQSLAEQDKLRQSPMDDYLRLTQGTNPSMPQMPSFMAGSGYNAANVAGAGQQQYGAAMDAYNANQAQSAGVTSGLFGLAGSALGGPLGGSLGSILGKQFGG